MRWDRLTSPCEGRLRNAVKGWIWAGSYYCGGNSAERMWDGLDVGWGGWGTKKPVVGRTNNGLFEIW